MPDPKKAAPDATDQAPIGRQEQEAEEVQDLPNRDAMSIFTGFPSMPGLPTPLLGDSSSLTPTPVDPATSPEAPVDGTTPPDASASPGELNTVSPTNNVTSSNVSSSGTTESTGAVQDAPIIQR
jgi:hypothetical protein